MTNKGQYLQTLLIFALQFLYINCQLGYTTITIKVGVIFSSKQIYQSQLEINPVVRQTPIGNVLIYNETLSVRVVYVGLDDGNIQLFNFTSDQKIESPYLIKKFSNVNNGKALLSNQNQTVIWFVKNYAIEIIDISSPLQPKLLYLHEINQKEKQNYFLNIQFDFSETRVFILRQGGFDLYQIQRDYSLVFIQSVFEEGIPVRSLKLMQKQTFIISSASVKGFSIYSSPSLNSTSFTLNNQKYPTEISPFNLLCRVIPDQSTNIIQVIVLNQKVFVLDEFQGFWVYSLFQVVQKNVCGASPLTTEYAINTAKENWNYQTISFHMYYNNQLILVVRSDIIKIFFNYPSNYIGKIQEIDTKLITGKSFAFNYDNSTFVLAGEQYVNIYKKVYPTSLRSYPNLLNIYQTHLTTNDLNSKPQVGMCQPDFDSVYILRQYAGSFMFSVNNLTQFRPNHFYYPNPNNQLDEGTALKYIGRNKGIIIVGVKRVGLFFYSVYKYASPSFIGSNSLINNIQQNPEAIESIRNNTYLLVANGIVGLSFVNITDIQNSKYLFTNKFGVEDYSFSGIVATNDGNYAFASARFYGYFAINISDIMNPVVMQRIISRGGEKVTLSQDQNFLIVSDATYGVSVVNITNRGIMELISTTKLNSHVYRITVFNENYILIAQRQESIVTLMNISNKKKPKIISKLQYPGLSDCYEICVSGSQALIQAITLNGVLTIQTYPSIYVHSELAEIIFDPITNQISNYRRMEPTENLYIGMAVELSLVQYNYDFNTQFFSAVTFLNGQFSSLPSWITFYQSTASFQINVIADSLDTSQIEHKGYLDIETSSNILQSNIQIAVLVFEQVLPNSFYDFILNIKEELSQKIYNQCIEQGIITIAEFVRQIIRNKQIILPIPITIASSLLYNNNPTISVFKAQNFTSYNSKYFSQKNQGHIITNQDFIYFTLYLQDKNAKFVPRKYSGALVSFSEEKDQIKIQGEHETVNEILQKQIQVYVNDTYINQVNLQVKIEDNVNIPITIVDNLVRFTFISFNQPVQINTEYTLQDDFQKKFDENIIYIQTDFIYQINRLCFIDLDDQETLTIKVKIISDDNTLEDIKISSWFQYNADDRKLYGTPVNKNYGEVINIRVLASDGFTEAYQDIKIYVTGIPFSYLFQLILKILSPILGCISIWRLKYIMINIVTVKRYSSPSPDIIKAGEIYHKQIPLIQNELEESEKIWKFISKQINEKKIKNDINIYIKQCKLNSKFNRDKQNSQALNQQEQNKSQDTQQNNGKNDQNKQENTLNSDNQLSRNSTLKSMKSINDSSNLKIRRKANTTLKQLFISHLKTQKSINNSISVMNQQLKDKDSFLQNDGGLNNSYALQTFKNFVNSNSNNQFIKNLRREILLKLDNQNSYLSLFLLFKVSELVLKYHNETLELYKYIKSVGVSQFGELEWYKAYTQIVHQFDNIFVQPFPQIKIDNQQVQNVIYLLHQEQQEIKSKKQSQNKNIQCKINFEEIQYLLGSIYDQIIGSAFGFSFINNSINARVLGVSLFEQKHNIATITALEKKEKKNLFSISNVLIPISLHNNSKLPSWITSLDIINNTILIQGKPENKDIGKIHIQIVDKTNIIAKQFEIEVIENEKYQDQSQQQILQEQQSQEQICTLNTEKTEPDETCQTIELQKRRSMNSPTGQSLLYRMDSPSLFSRKKFDLFKQSETETNVGETIQTEENETENQIQTQMNEEEDEVNEDEKEFNIKMYDFSTRKNSENRVDTSN